MVEVIIIDNPYRPVLGSSLFATACYYHFLCGDRNWSSGLLIEAHDPIDEMQPRPPSICNGNAGRARRFEYLFIGLIR
jgi:hypothetical protein